MVQRICRFLNNLNIWWHNKLSSRNPIIVIHPQLNSGGLCFQASPLPLDWPVGSPLLSWHLLYGAIASDFLAFGFCYPDHGVWSIPSTSGTTRQPRDWRRAAAPQDEWLAGVWAGPPALLPRRGLQRTRADEGFKPASFFPPLLLVCAFPSKNGSCFFLSQIVGEAENEEVHQRKQRVRGPEKQLLFYSACCTSHLVFPVVFRLGNMRTQPLVWGLAGCMLVFLPIRSRPKVYEILLNFFLNFFFFNSGHTWLSPWHFWLFSWLVLEWVRPCFERRGCWLHTGPWIGVGSSAPSLTNAVRWAGNCTPLPFPSPSKWDKSFRVVVRIEIDVYEVPGTS